MRTFNILVLTLFTSIFLYGQTINLPSNCSDCGNANSLYCNDIEEVSSFTHYLGAYLIVSDGELYGFGENHNTMLGFPVEGQTVFKPRKLPPIEALNQTWKQAYSIYKDENEYVAYDIGDFYALSTDGDIYVWGGENAEGYVNGGSSAMNPTRIPSSDKFTQIYIGTAQGPVASDNYPYFARTTTGQIKYFRSDQTPIGNFGITIDDRQDALDFTDGGVLVVESGTNDVFHIDGTTLAVQRTNIKGKKVSKNVILGIDNRLYTYSSFYNATRVFPNITDIKDVDFSFNTNGIILTNSNQLYVAVATYTYPSYDWSDRITGIPSGILFTRVEIEDITYHLAYTEDGVYSVMSGADLFFDEFKAPFVTQPTFDASTKIFPFGCY